MLFFGLYRYYSKLSAPEPAGRWGAGGAGRRRDDSLVEEADLA